MKLFNRKQKQAEQSWDKMFADTLATAFAKQMAAYRIEQEQAKPTRACESDVTQLPTQSKTAVFHSDKKTKRPYHRTGKYSKKAKEQAKQDTLKPIRDRFVASKQMTPDEFRQYAHIGDVYYIPYPDNVSIGLFQSKYSGRVSDKFKTKTSTIFGVNSCTHKAENLMKIEVISK